MCLVSGETPVRVPTEVTEKLQMKVKHDYLFSKNSKMDFIYCSGANA